MIVAPEHEQVVRSARELLRNLGLEGLSLDLDALWSEVELLGPESGEEALGDPEAQ
ncbi:hypothetical protein [Sorangium sp. So ce117]|uniref:hypothetical protein n=1 Tax=Sorangium sp. So ce117 TaxID=3133277 RepID=UPI003F635C94